MITKEKVQDADFMSEAEAMQKKRENESKLSQQKEIYYKRNEALMKELGVMEVPILGVDPVRGITPSSVVVLHEWKEGETYINAPKVKESVANIKKDGKKSTK